MCAGERLATSLNSSGPHTWDRVKNPLQTPSSPFHQEGNSMAAIIMSVYTKDVFATIRTTVAKATAFAQHLDKLVETGTLTDAEWLDNEDLKAQHKCFALISPEIRIECAMIRQWGRTPNPQKDTVSVTINAAKYPDQLAGLLKDTDLNLEAWGTVR
jgi:hypothetical protein